jgi:hypothetical protein
LPLPAEKTGGKEDMEMKRKGGITILVFLAITA